MIKTAQELFEMVSMAIWMLNTGGDPVDQMREILSAIADWVEKEKGGELASIADSEKMLQLLQSLEEKERENLSLREENIMVKREYMRITYRATNAEAFANEARKMELAESKKRCEEAHQQYLNSHRREREHLRHLEKNQSVVELAAAERRRHEAERLELQERLNRLQEERAEAEAAAAKPPPTKRRVNHAGLRVVEVLS